MKGFLLTSILLSAVLLTEILVADPVGPNDTPGLDSRAAPDDLRSDFPVLIRDEAFQADAREAIDSLYNRNPESARDKMTSWMNRYPDHPIWYLWDAMEVWWQVLNDLYDESLDEQLFDVMDRADEAAAQLLSLDPDHPDAHIIQAVANGYAARHHANRDRWVRSVRTAQSARRAHEELYRLEPELKDNLLAEGLKLYYSAYLPEEYPILRPFRWLLPGGDREKGISLLEESSREGLFTRPEAAYFLGIILLRYENRPDEATVLFEELVEKYPDNTYYRRLLIRSYFDQGREPAARAEIERTLESWPDGAEGASVLHEEIYYWLGRIEMRNGVNGRAHEHFVKSWESGIELPNRTRRSFHALSGYYAGITAERQGDPDTARSYYMSVINLECEPDIRKRADERLKEL